MPYTDKACKENERPWYIAARHKPFDEPMPVDAPPRTEGPFRTRPSKWDNTLARLKMHPGQWFIICEYSGIGSPPTSLGDLAMKRGFSVEMCERVGGPSSNRTTRVYARRVPEADVA